MNTKALFLILALFAASAFATFETDCLYYHNNLRGSLGLNDFIWSDSLAADSAAYAEVLAGTSHLKHSTDRVNTGENLSMGTLNVYDTEMLIDLWINEKRHYIPGAKFPHTSTTGNWKDVAHYTQMVWRETTEVGCGVATNEKWRFMVCRYKRAGNIVGQYPY